ncbi:MAG: PAS domain S-box protein [Thermodesulfobacteriota bacterium]
MDPDAKEQIEKLERQLRSAQKETSDLRLQLDALMKGSKHVLKYEGFSGTARSLFDLCKKQIGAKSGYVALLSPNGDENEVLFLDAGGLSCTVNTELPMPIRGLRACAYATGAVAYENDFENSEWQAFMPEGHVRLKNVMFAPLVHNGKTVGLLGLANKASDFDEKDTRIASVFGQLAAIALREARRIDEISEAERAKRKSEARFQALFNSMNEGVCLHEIVKDKQGRAIDYRILDVNAAFENIVQIPKEEAAGKSTSQLYGTGDAPFLKTYAKVVESGKPESFETFWPSLQKYFIVSAFSPGEGQFATVFTDITQQKTNEELLRISEEYLATTLDSIGDAVITADVNGQVARMNPIAEALTGWASEQAKGRALSEVFKIFNQHTRKKVECPVHKVFREGAVVGLANDTLLISRDGQEYNIDDSAAPIRDSAGQIIGAVMIFRNITEKYRAEAELRQSEERFRLAFQTSPDAINLNRLEDGLYIDINQGFSQIMGYSPEDVIGRTSLDLSIWKNAEDRRYLVEELKRNGYVQNLDAEFITKDGQIRNGLMSARVLKINNEDVIISLTRDITEKKAAEKKMLRQSQIITMNSRIANVFLTSPRDKIYSDVLTVLLESLCSLYGFFGYVDDDGALVCPTMTREIWKNCQIPDKSIRFSPNAFGGLWGRSFNEKKTLVANEGLNLPEGHVKLENALAVPIVHRDHLLGQIAVANKPGGYTAEDQEILESAAKQIAPILSEYLDKARQEQERKNLETQLQQAQKMEAIGTLAGGIAHDFNNILSSVLGFTELSLDQLESGTPLYSNLSEVMSAGMRAKALVKQILTLSRQERQVKKPVDVVPLLKEALKMLRSTVPASIEIRQNINKQNLIVHADPTQIHQVIMNLATNALHAMADMEGILEVGAQPINFDREYMDLAAGMYVKISVSDTGVGIPDIVKGKIFEPYFTTKDQGHGTGLGLSVVHGIVKSHKGHISVYSEPGAGTVFYIYLPMAERHSVEMPDQKPAGLPTGNESILVVDDEVPIVKMHQQSLARLGYKTTARSSSVEALEAFRAWPDKYDLIITDMTMPQMTGEKLANAVKEIRPDIPVVLCTGFSERIEGREEELAIDGILMKPIAKQQMAETVRAVLDASKKK